MIRSIPLLALMSLLVCCGSRSSLPAGVLPSEKMESVLWDMLRADLFVSNYVAIRDSSLAGHAKGPQLYGAILKKHGISDTVFKLSLDYYQNNPKQFSPILDSIGQRPAPAPTPIIAEPPKKSDSIPPPKPVLKGGTKPSGLTPLAY